MSNLIDNPTLAKLLTPRERLEEVAKMNPSQVIAVAIVENQIKITWDFLEEKHMIGMLNALEDQLKKEIQFRRRKNGIDAVNNFRKEKYGKK